MRPPPSPSSTTTRCSSRWSSSPPSTSSTAPRPTSTTSSGSARAPSTPPTPPSSLYPPPAHSPPPHLHPPQHRAVQRADRAPVHRHPELEGGPASWTPVRRTGDSRILVLLRTGGLQASSAEDWREPLEVPCGGWGRNSHLI